MTKRQAITALKSQKIKLNSPCGIVWITQTISYIEKIFGKDSEQYKMIIGFKGMSIKDSDYDIYIKRLEILFDTWIEDIQNGLMQAMEESMFEKRMFQALAFMGGIVFSKIIENWKEVYTWFQQALHK